MANEPEVFDAPPPAKYDGIIREGSYMMQHLLTAFDASLGVNIPKNASAEDQARAEYGEVVQAVTHARNVLRSLAARRDALGDALEVVERPRVEAAERGPVPQADGDSDFSKEPEGFEETDRPGKAR